MARGALVLVVLAALAAAVGGTSTSAATHASGCPRVKTPKPRSESRKPPKTRLDPRKTWKATVQTTCGSFTILLAVKVSPKTTASFVSLARSRFFDNTIFHRVVPGFVIQGGDPTATGTGGPGYSTVDKPPKNAAYTHGVVAMAKTATEPAGTAGSQFFIVTVTNAGLPPDYAIIGKVVKGLSVVDHIGTLGDASQQPTQVVEIRQATVAVH